MNDKIKKAKKHVDWTIEDARNYPAVTVCYIRSLESELVEARAEIKLCPGEYVKEPNKTCLNCGEPYKADLHSVSTKARSLWVVAVILWLVVVLAVRGCVGEA